jgi:2-dehydro-3-deoxygluconokinase
VSIVASENVFLGIGECMVELAATGAPGSYRQGYAGDVFNTLWYAARCLGPSWKVRFQTALGVDPLSDELAAFAGAAGIDCSEAPRLPGVMPGLYMIRLERGERRFLYWRGQSAARRMMADPAEVERQIDAAQVIYLSGITLAILPAADRATLIAMMGRARAGGRLVAFDPNIRPALWEDAEAMRTTLTEAAGASSVVLPSFDDERAAFADVSPEATISRYRASGCPLVVVKNGPAPVVAGDDIHVQTIPTPQIHGPVIDSTAAGDSFNAAFLSAWLNRKDLAVAVQSGQALAAQVLKGHGALVEEARLRPAHRNRDDDRHAGSP